MAWQVDIPKRAEKQSLKLPKAVLDALGALLRDIKSTGPVQGKWPNYSKLPGNRHHCHLKKGRPTYVAVWEVIDKKVKLVEVEYVGTHEKAPY